MALAMRGPRVSPPAACAYHHHIDVILNSHFRSKDRRERVCVCMCVYMFVCLCVHIVVSSAGFRGSVWFGIVIARGRR
jgi:hypothetical protein